MHTTFALKSTLSLSKQSLSFNIMQTYLVNKLELVPAVRMIAVHSRAWTLGFVFENPMFVTGALISFEDVRSILILHRLRMIEDLIMDLSSNLISKASQQINFN